MRDYLKEQIENFDWDEFYNTEYQFIIEKDGGCYTGMAKVGEINPK